jgi:hypothetical protein
MFAFILGGRKHGLFSCGKELISFFSFVFIFFFMVGK